MFQTTQLKKTQYDVHFLLQYVGSSIAQNFVLSLFILNTLLHSNQSFILQPAIYIRDKFTLQVLLLKKNTILKIKCKK